MKRSEHIRVWGARAALLVGFGWLLYKAASYRNADATFLGRYPVSYLLLMMPFVAGAVVAAVLAPGPKLKRLVVEGSFRVKAAIVAAWLPGMALVYFPSYLLSPDGALWNSAFGVFAGALTLAMILVVGDIVRALIRKPEFWMVIVSVSLGLVLSEVGMRYWVHNIANEKKRLLYDPALQEVRITPRFRQHHYEGYIPNPEWATADGEDRINSLGFRGEEIAIPKPDGVYRIVAVGGSSTFGTSVKRWEEAYPAQLEQVLHEEYGYTNVEVINGGVGGHNSWETLISLEFRVLDLEPDLVIVYQNANDVHARLVLPDAYKGDNSGRRKLWDAKVVEEATPRKTLPSVLWRFVGINFGWLQKRANAELNDAFSQPCTGARADKDCLGISPRKALEANPPVYYERNIRNMIAIAHANGAEVLLLTWAYRSTTIDYTSRGYYQDAFKEHNLIVERLAGEMDARFYDFAADMPLDKEYWDDGLHMTVEGNRVRAELIAAYLDENGVIPNP